MKCKDIERLIVDSPEEELSPEKLSEIEFHVSECARCAGFQEDLKKIRLCFKEMTLPVPSAELVKQTQLLCHAKMRTLQASGRKNDVQALLTRIPKLIWVSLFSLIALTLIWIFPLFEDFKLDQPPSFQTIAVLFLVIQNAAMLFFAPILIRNYRVKNHDVGSI